MHSPEPDDTGTAGWLRVSITTNANTADMVAAFAGSLAGGCEQMPGPTGEQETVVCYLPVSPQLQEELHEIREFLERLGRTLPEHGRPVMETETIGNQDWNRTWKERFKPFSITSHLVIKPSWEEFSAESGQKVIEMDPGMAFGTGHHASTRLALLFIEQIFHATTPPPGRVLDVGTGTGILAMAAALFGADKAVAMDNDPEAVAVAAENVGRNGLESLIEVSALPLGEIRDTFDLVIANIIHDTLLELAEDLRGHIAQGGRLILAGILAGEQSDNIRAAYERLGLRHLETKSEGEWSSLLFARP